MFWPILESRNQRTPSSAPGTTSHQSVMERQVIDFLNCQPGKNYLDLTAGGGGHSEAILNATSPDGKVVAVDWDKKAPGPKLPDNVVSETSQRYKQVQELLTGKK